MATFRTDQQIEQACGEMGEAAVEAGIESGLFDDNKAAALKWLITQRQVSANQRIEQEMRHTRLALYSSWALVVLTFCGLAVQTWYASAQRDQVEQQMKQQRKDSESQRDEAKALLAVQIAVELDKQFDSPEMRHARRRLAGQLLGDKEVTESSAGLLRQASHVSAPGEN